MKAVLVPTIRFVPTPHEKFEVKYYLRNNDYNAAACTMVIAYLKSK